jgi:glycosyltransferase involved in cell wall biosynthesis
MRIAVWHNLPSGGGKRALHDHVRGLVERGHDLTVWCPETADRDFLPLSRFATEHVLPLETRPLPAGVRRLMQFANASPRALERIEAMRAHAASFAAIVSGGGYDVVFANSCRWFFTPLIGAALEIPSVLYLQEPARWLYEARPTQVWAAEPDRPGRWWEPTTIRHWLGSAARLHPVRVQAREEHNSARAFGRVLVNSRFSRESVLRALGVDASVCYLGIDTERFQLSEEAREPFLLSVGEFSIQKGPLFVIRAVAQSVAKPPLVWVANRADAGLAEAAHALSREVGVNFTLKVGVSEHELVGLYQRATALVYAPQLEPFGLTPLEANACGTPVIGVAEGGVRETVEHELTGLLVERDEEEVAAAVDKLMTNPLKARELGRNAAARVRMRWSINAATERLEAQLTEIRSSHPESCEPTRGRRSIEPEAS